MSRLNIFYEQATRMLEMSDLMVEERCQIYIAIALLRIASLMEEDKRRKS